MFRIISLLFFLVSSSAWADPPILRLHGSNTIGAQLAPALVKTWLVKNGVTDVRVSEKGFDEVFVTGRDRAGRPTWVEINAHGSATAFTGLARGVADVGMASRAIKANELTAHSSLHGLKSLNSEYVIGLDGIAIIVHPQNPIAVIDKKSLAAVFAGQVRDWSQVGGATGPIRLYARDDNSGTFDTFKSLVLGETPMDATAKRFESSLALADAVAADPGAIGFIGLPYVRRAKALAVADTATRAIAPNAFSVATEDYPLSRRLFLYVPSGAPARARDFAEFTASSEGQAIVAREGFVGQEILAHETEAFEGAPTDYVVLTRGARRLSVNFRFREGVAYLDNKALRDIERVVAFMRSAPRGTRLILCGFSDRKEVMPLRALDLSNQRADQVADILMRKGVHPYHVRGFGATSAVASEDTPADRNKNRRVEIWIK